MSGAMLAGLLSALDSVHTKRATASRKPLGDQSITASEVSRMTKTSDMRRPIFLEMLQYFHLKPGGRWCCPTGADGPRPSATNNSNYVGSKYSLILR